MSALEQDLDEFLAGPDPDFDADPEPPQDADEADRRLRRLAKVRAEIAQVEEDAAREFDRINEWAERRYQVLHGRARWLQAGLEMWHRAVLADDPSRKTISLPCGTLKSRAQQPEWVFDPPGAAGRGQPVRAVRHAGGPGRRRAGGGGPVTAPTDPVERAARIIADCIDGPSTTWDDLSDRWQSAYRSAARLVLDDLAANTPTDGEAA